MAVNKVILRDEVIIDLTQDTAVEEDVMSGKTFHKADGTQVVGTLVPSGGGDKFFDLVNGTLTELTAEDLNGVTQIRDYAFGYEAQLNSIEIPNSVVTIGESAFYNCKALRSITFHSGIETIQRLAFYGCSAINTTYLDSLEAYLRIDFQSDTSIPTNNATQAIYINGELAENVVVPNSITKINAYAFRKWRCMTSLEIPDNVTTIGNSVFVLCEGLETVTIGNGITSIGSMIFLSCSKLERVTINATTPPTIGSDIFYGCNALTEIIVPAGCGDAYKSATNWSKYASKIVEATA